MIPQQQLYSGRVPRLLQPVAKAPAALECRRREDEPGRWSRLAWLRRGFGTRMPRAHTWYLDYLVTASHKAISHHTSRQGDIPAGAHTDAETQPRMLGALCLQHCKLVLLHFCVCFRWSSLPVHAKNKFSNSGLVSMVHSQSPASLRLKVSIHSQKSCLPQITG